MADMNQFSAAPKMKTLNVNKKEPLWQWIIQSPEENYCIFMVLLNLFNGKLICNARRLNTVFWSE